MVTSGDLAGIDRDMNSLKLIGLAAGLEPRGEVPHEYPDHDEDHPENQALATRHPRARAPRRAQWPAGSVRRMRGRARESPRGGCGCGGCPGRRLVSSSPTTARAGAGNASICLRLTSSSGRTSNARDGDRRHRARSPGAARQFQQKRLRLVVLGVPHRDVRGAGLRPGTLEKAVAQPPRDHLDGVPRAAARAPTSAPSTTPAGRAGPRTPGRTPRRARTRAQPVVEVRETGKNPTSRAIRSRSTSASATESDPPESATSTRLSGGQSRIGVMVRRTIWCREVTPARCPPASPGLVRPAPTLPARRTRVFRDRADAPHSHPVHGPRARQR
jgi:hypothetical protein